jgi:hypothetical protein
MTPSMIARLLPRLALVAFDAAGESNACTFAFLVVVVVVSEYSLM